FQPRDVGRVPRVEHRAEKVDLAGDEIRVALVEGRRRRRCAEERTVVAQALADHCARLSSSTRAQLSKNTLSTTLAGTRAASASPRRGSWDTSSRPAVTAATPSKSEPRPT